MNYDKLNFVDAELLVTSVKYTKRLGDATKQVRATGNLAQEPHTEHEGLDCSVYFDIPGEMEPPRVGSPIFISIHS